jgi:hypothetical protein
LHCDCDSQELWEWLRDHQKLIRMKRVSRNDNVGIKNHIRNRSLNEREIIGNRMDSNDVTSLLRCEKPSELRGLVFLDLDLHMFCSAPLIPKVIIQDIQAYSIHISWQSRNYPGLQGYQVIFHPLHDYNKVIVILCIIISEKFINHFRRCLVNMTISVNVL